MDVLELDWTGTVQEPYNKFSRRGTPFRVLCKSRVTVPLRGHSFKSLLIILLSYFKKTTGNNTAKSVAK